MEQSFIAYIENSIKNNWDLDALTDYKGATLQYKSARETRLPFVEETALTGELLSLPH